MSSVVLKSPLRITYHFFKRMVWSVEMNSHPDTSAVVSDALILLLSLNRSLYDVYQMKFSESYLLHMSK